MIRPRQAAALSTLMMSLLLTGCAHSDSTPAPPTTIAAPDYATAPIDLTSPEATAYAMMIAMYRGDVDLVDQVFAPDATLRRLRANGEIDPNGLPRWRDWVGTLEVGQAHEELFDIQVEQFDRLATVWAPFVIRLNGEIRGCGVNQFTMVDFGEDGISEWRIVAGMDVQAEREGCAGFRDRHPEKK